MFMPLVIMVLMAKKKYIISKGKLKDLYWAQKFSISEIAIVYGCATVTIENRMKEHNIKRRASGPRRIKISKNALLSLYVERGMSANKIANICHCEKTAILNKLDSYKIKKRNPKRKIGIFKNDLEKLYLVDKFSTYKIADIFNCRSSTVYRYLKLYDIKTRPLKKIEITKDELDVLYNMEKKCLSEIAKIYKCCAPTILRKMQKYGIKRREFSETSTQYPKKDFDGDIVEKAYMIGFRLGDLRVRKDHNLIQAGCGTTKQAQVDLIKEVFGFFGHFYVTNRNSLGVMHADCSLNTSFSFLLPKHTQIPKWILRSKKNFLSFLAGYTDAEGNIGIDENRARFRVRTYDKKILQEINHKLNELGIKSSFRLEQKAHKDRRGVFHRKDSWRVGVYERQSLLKLFSYLQPLLKHKKRASDLSMGLQNVKNRLKRNI